MLANSGSTPTEIAFYTVFCGTSDKVANQVKPAPSSSYPCFFFTDNSATFEEATQQGWLAVRLPGNPSSDDITANMKAKNVKVRPHMYNQLRSYKYTVYQDSKLATTEVEVLSILKTVPPNKSIAMRLHNIMSPPMLVWDEFELAMTQSRYQRQRQQMTSYVEERLRQGYQDSLQIHFWCSFIIRDMQALAVELINEKWFDEISSCGIDDQLSMFFVYQDFPEEFQPLSRNLLPHSQSQ